MLDLGEIDHALAALGPAPEATAELIERVLGRERSPEWLDAELAALEGASPSVPVITAGASGAASAPRPVAERASFQLAAPPAAAMIGKPTNARSTWIGQPTVPPVAPEPARTSFEPPFAVRAVASASHDDAHEPDAEIDYTEAGAEPEPEPAVAAAPAAIAPASMEALLDQDLDPRDFPQSEPPASVPAGSAHPSAASNAAEEDTDFELLVEDDEILEIEDVELVEEDE